MWITDFGQVIIALCHFGLWHYEKYSTALTFSYQSDVLFDDVVGVSLEWSPWEQVTIDRCACVGVFLTNAFTPFTSVQPARNKSTNTAPMSHGGQDHRAVRPRGAFNGL